MSAKERRELLGRVRRDASSRTSGPGVAHRRAVLAGAPTRLPHFSGRESPLGPLGRRPPKPGAALEHQARARQVAFGWAKEVGTGRVGFAYPGAAGHEKCSDVCVTYG